MLKKLYKKNDISPLDPLIDNVIEEMAEFGVYNEDYDRLLACLEKLYDIRDESKSRKRISPDTLATVAGNLIGILMIVSYEHTHVITSKAISHIRMK